MAANVETVSKALNVTPRRVQQLVGEGMPRAQKGLYDLGQCMAWYIRYLQKAIEKRHDPSREDESQEFTRERSRLAREQADKVSLDNARRRGELIYAPQVAEVLATLGSDLAGRHDALPGRVANELAGISDAAIIRSRLLDELRLIRGAFAEAASKLADAIGNSPDAGVDSNAAEKKKPKRVGRRKSKSARGKRRARAVEKQADPVLHPDI